MGLFDRRGSSWFGRDRVVDRDPIVGRGGYYGFLTAPSLPLFLISVVMAVGVALSRFGHVDVPVVTASNAFEILAIAYAILLAGVLLPRL